MVNYCFVARLSFSLSLSSCSFFFLLECGGMKGYMAWAVFSDQITLRCMCVHHLFCTCVCVYAWAFMILTSIYFALSDWIVCPLPSANIQRDTILIWLFWLRVLSKLSNQHQNNQHYHRNCVITIGTSFSNGVFERKISNFQMLASVWLMRQRLHLLLVLLHFIRFLHRLAFLLIFFHFLVIYR